MVARAGFQGRDGDAPAGRGHAARDPGRRQPAERRSAASTPTTSTSSMPSRRRPASPCRTRASATASASRRSTTRSPISPTARCSWTVSSTRSPAASATTSRWRCCSSTSTTSRRSTTASATWPGDELLARVADRLKTRAPRIGHGGTLRRRRVRDPRRGNRGSARTRIRVADRVGVGVQATLRRRRARGDDQRVDRRRGDGVARHHRRGARGTGRRRDVSRQGQGQGHLRDLRAGHAGRRRPPPRGAHRPRARHRSPRARGPLSADRRHDHQHAGGCRGAGALEASPLGHGRSRRVHRHRRGDGHDPRARPPRARGGVQAVAGVAGRA